MARLLGALLAAALVLSLSGRAAAIDETDYAAQFYGVVKPTIEACSSVGSFTGKEGIEIEYIAVEPDLLPGEQPRGALILLNGRTESFYKYFEVAYDLRWMGLTIYMMDHRGQGASERILSDPMKGYVQDFGDYVDDVKTLVETVVKPAGFQKIILLGQSMGGAVATVYAERHAADLAAVVLTSPMVQINTSPYPEAAAYAVAAFNAATGKGADYAPGQSPFDPAAWPFEDNRVTSSYPRWAMGRDLLVSRPELVLGGTTNKWIKEAIEGTWEARGRAWEIKLPVLLLQAGLDQLVKLSGQDWVCNRAASCRKVRFENGLHELLQERDEIREPALETVADFILEQLD